MKPALRATVIIFASFAFLLMVALIVQGVSRRKAQRSRSPDVSARPEGASSKGSVARPELPPSPEPRKPEGSSPTVRGSISGQAFVPSNLRDSMNSIRLKTTRSLGFAGGAVGTKVRNFKPGFAEDGKYSLRELVLGDYFIELTLGEKTVSERIRVSLTAERPVVTGADFRFGPAMGREIWGSVISGRGSSPPIAGAQVSLIGEPPVESDASGTFRMSGVPDGDIKILVTHAEHESCVVQVAAGATSSLIVELIPFGALEVTATDPSGLPRAGVEFRLEGQKFMDMKSTDAAGVALFTALRTTSGAYTLTTLQGRIVNPPRSIEVVPGERKKLALHLE